MALLIDFVQFRLNESLIFRCNIHLFRFFISNKLQFHSHPLHPSPTYIAVRIQLMWLFPDCRARISQTKIFGSIIISKGYLPIPPSFISKEFSGWPYNRNLIEKSTSQGYPLPLTNHYLLKGESILN